MKCSATFKHTAALIAVAIGFGCFAAVRAGDDHNKTEYLKKVQSTNTPTTQVSVRYMIYDVTAAVGFYTKHFGFKLDVDSSPTFASVVRGNLRLLLSGEK